MAKNVTYIWRARKCNRFGLPWTFTVYALTEDKFIKKTGFLNKRQEEVILYRFVDMSTKASLWQRLFGMGTIHCWTTDKSSDEFEIVNIKHHEGVKELIFEASEACKKRRGYTVRELMGNHDISDEENSDVLD